LLLQGKAAALRFLRIKNSVSANEEANAVAEANNAKTVVAQVDDRHPVSYRCSWVCL